jgi:hypothetical protein
MATQQAKATEERGYTPTKIPGVIRVGNQYIKDPSYPPPQAQQTAPKRPAYKPILDKMTDTSPRPQLGLVPGYNPFTRQNTLGDVEGLDHVQGYAKGGLVGDYQGGYDAANQQFLKNGPLTDFHPVDEAMRLGDKAAKYLKETSNARANAISQGLQKPSATLEAIGNTGTAPVTMAKGIPVAVGNVLGKKAYAKDYQKGGEVKGPGTSTSDSIPAKLSKGEVVIPANVVRHFGLGMFKKMIAAVPPQLGAKTQVKEGVINAAAGVNYQDIIDKTTGVKGQANYKPYRPMSNEASNFTQSTQGQNYNTVEGKPGPVYSEATPKTFGGAGQGLLTTQIAQQVQGNPLVQGNMQSAQSNLENQFGRKLPALPGTMNAQTENAPQHFADYSNALGANANPTKPGESVDAWTGAPRPPKQAPATTPAAQAAAPAPEATGQEANASPTASINQSQQPYQLAGGRGNGKLNPQQGAPVNTMDFTTSPTEANPKGGFGSVQFKDGRKLSNASQDYLGGVLARNADPGFQARLAEQAKIVDDRYAWKNQQQDKERQQGQQDYLMNQIQQANARLASGDLGGKHAAANILANATSQLNAMRGDQQQAGQFNQNMAWNRENATNQGAIEGSKQKQQMDIEKMKLGADAFGTRGGGYDPNTGQIAPSIVYSKKTGLDVGKDQPQDEDIAPEEYQSPSVKLAAKQAYEYAKANPDEQLPPRIKALVAAYLKNQNK